MIVIGVLALLAGVGIGIYNLVENETGKGFAACAGVILVPVMLLFGSFRSVGANQVGIVYDDRYGIVDATYGEGFGTKSIFEHITTISTTNRTATVTTTGQTNDGQYATFDLSLIYKIEKENAGKFYRVTGDKDIGKEDLDSLVKKCLQSSTINYDIFALLSEGLETARLDFYDDLKADIYDGHRSDYENQRTPLENKLNTDKTLTVEDISEINKQIINKQIKDLDSKIETASGYYITLVSVSFDDVDGGEKVEAILQAKAEAEQRIQIAQKEAEAAMITAQNQAEIQKLLADAAAYATRVEGEANGEAASAYVDKIMAMIDDLYTNMSGTLTYEQCAQIVLSIIFYDTWDGKLPEVMTGDAFEGLIGGLIAGTGSS